MKNKIITKERIIKDLINIRIKPKEKIIVHSSLSSIGYVEGGPTAVCEAFMELITEDGVIMMPSFNHGIIFEKGTSEYYDPMATPTINGKVPDTFWRMKEVFRSLNPTHPFAVFGKNAKHFVKDHHKVLTMGEDSPLYRLEQEGGKVILIGCPHANTFHHVVEMTNNVPCLGKRIEEYPVKLPNGKIVKCRTWGYRDGKCPINDGINNLYIEEMKKRKILKEGKIGNATTIVFYMKDCRKVIEEFLHGKIIGKPSCKECNVKPRKTRFTVKSDWDEKENKVKANTSAFIGDVY